VVKNATTGRAWVIVVTWFVVLGSALLALFAITPWPLIFFCLAGVAVIIWHRSTATFGIAASILLHLAAVAVLIQLSPATRLPLDLTVSALLILEACAVAWAVTSATRPPRRDLFITLARRSLFFVVPVVACLVEAISSLLGRSGVAWAMGNDSAFNVMSARILFADGGVNSRLHFNGSPEPHSLLTVVTGAGRWNVGSWDLFQHDVSAYAQLWFLLIIATAVLSALVARQVMPSGTPPWFTIVATNAVALVPLTLFVSGYAVRFGFFNATLSLVILLSAWLISRSESVSAATRLTALGLASLALLATWGPLAIVPVALAIPAFWQLMRQVRREGFASPRKLIMPGAIIVANALYVSLVTVADLVAAQGALANDGGIFWLSPYLAAAVVIVTLSLLTIHARLNKSFSGLLDGVAATLGGAVAILFLVYQRRDEANVWGYYPIKFSWLLVTLFSIVSLALILSLIARLRPRGIILAGAGVAIAAVALGVVIVSPAIRERALDAFPLLSVAGIPSHHPGDYAASVMFRNKESGVNTIAVNALTSAEDAFINLWLVQIEPTLNSLDVRVFAYGIDGNNTAQVCAAIETMAAPVRILTQEQGLRERLLKECPNANFEIVAPRL
jgi:hypothetical protein